MFPLVKIVKASVFIPGQIERELVLQGLYLTVRPGEHTVITGVNGSGKSTLLRLIHGDLWPASGSIAWAGKDGAEERSRIAARACCSLVSPHIQERLQQQALQMTAKEWLLQDSSLDPLPQDNGKLELCAHNWLGRLDAGKIWSLPLAAMSQGQLRLCLLERAFLRKSPLLLLDEYTDGLDASHSRRVHECLDEMRACSTMIIVSHRARDIPSWAVKSLELSEGKLRPASRKAQDEAQAGNGPAVKGACSEKKLFQVRNATVFCGETPVLKNISWTCLQGQHWRIGGANGAGKSTFLRMLAGDEFVASGGFAHVFNPVRNCRAKSLDEKRRIVSLVSDRQQACYAYDLSGLELVCSGFENSIGLYREFSDSERLAAMDAIGYFFENESPEKIAASSIRRLSSGQLRRLFLARAIVARPHALLLDEPFSMLDSESRKLGKRLLERLGTQGWNDCRPAIIFVSHNPEDAPEYVSREAELRDGRLVVIN